MEFLSLKGGCTGWSESILVIMPHCLKSRFSPQTAAEANKGLKHVGLDATKPVFHGFPTKRYSNKSPQLQ